MRDFSKVGPKFWIGSTGKKLRAAGPHAQVVAMYLLTCPQANMLGLFYCPVMFIAHETGLGFEGASKGLQSAIEAGFCEYDEDSEVVWVVEMARYQIGETLKPADKRVAGVQNEYNAVPQNPFLSMFYDKYAAAFCMENRREQGSPLEAPLKPLGSQEIEIEIEKEIEKKDIRTSCASLVGASAPQAVPPSDGLPTPQEPAPTAGKPPKAAKPGKSAVELQMLLDAGVPSQAAQDWLKVRKEKRLPLTATALDRTRREADKAGMTLAQAVQLAAGNSWAGFEASWVLKQGGGSPSGGAAARQRPVLDRDFSTVEYGEGGKL